jgi:hypothetical protein
VLEFALVRGSWTQLPPIARFAGGRHGAPVASAAIGNLSAVTWIHVCSLGVVPVWPFSDGGPGRHGLDAPAERCLLTINHFLLSGRASVGAGHIR